MTTAQPIPKEVEDGEHIGARPSNEDGYRVGRLRFVVRTTRNNSIESTSQVPRRLKRIPVGPDDYCQDGLRRRGRWHGRWDG